ncbi:MAG TPA: alkaline phosphatase family protein, partial [Gemmatimonadaceae bacterium]|nr:alkaline phosphatase family protein [Gemmatimonadaceae bacterium]
LRRRYWRATQAERRQALMPFVWGTMARQGALLGNRDLGSRVNVTNGKDFSYPGYNELLTGRPDARIDRNDVGANPNVTVFEWLDGRDGFRGRVAAVGGWDAFRDIFNVRRSGLPVHATRREPIDASTHAAALRVLQERRPRALFVAYVETDDWAHQGRYDRTLEAVHRLDAALAQLWAAAQADPRTRGRTTLILTADHGRGRTVRDWRNHGAHVPGASEVLVGMLGPATPALGEVRGGSPLAQAQVAATVAAAVGEDFRGVTGRAAPPIRLGRPR